MKSHRPGFILALCILVPLPGAAQNRRLSWEVRAEAGPGKVDWWNNPGLFVQVGLSVAGSQMSPFAVDMKILNGRGGDGPGSNAEGFGFVLLGPELRLQPASRVSPFLAAHLGLGSDEDGGMYAVTGEAGVRLRTGDRINLRLTGLTDVAFDAWGLTLGVAARL